MKHHDIYRDWIQTHRQTEADPGLAEAVMCRINRTEGGDRRNAYRWSRLLDTICESRWAQAAAVIVAAMIGFGRILLTLHMLLLT